jgi:hypothetical protein
VVADVEQALIANHKAIRKNFENRADLLVKTGGTGPGTNPKRQRIAELAEHITSVKNLITRILPASAKFLSQLGSKHVGRLVSLPDHWPRFRTIGLLYVYPKSTKACLHPWRWHTGAEFNCAKA